MNYLRLYLILSITMSPAFVALATSENNKAVILAFIAALITFALTVIGLNTLIQRLRDGRSAQA